MLSVTFEDNKLYIVEKEEDGKHFIEAMKLVNDILNYCPTAVINTYDNHESIICRNIGLEIPMQCYACITLIENDVELIKALLKQSTIPCLSGYYNHKIYNRYVEINEFENGFKIKFTNEYRFLIQQLTKLFNDCKLNDSELIIKNRSTHTIDILKKMFN